MELQKAAGRFGYDVKKVRHAMWCLGSGIQLINSPGWKASVGAEDLPYWRRGWWLLLVFLMLSSLLRNQTKSRAAVSLRRSPALLLFFISVSFIKTKIIGFVVCPLLWLKACCDDIDINYQLITKRSIFQNISYRMNNIWMDFKFWKNKFLELCVEYMIYM